MLPLVILAVIIYKSISFIPCFIVMRKSVTQSDCPYLVASVKKIFKSFRKLFVRSVRRKFDLHV